MFPAAIGIDAHADAHTRRAETDPGTRLIIVVFTTLNVALARRIIVGVALADNYPAFPAFPPALAFFVTNHPDLLDSVIRQGHDAVREGGGAGGRHEKRAGASSESDCELVHIHLQE